VEKPLNQDRGPADPETLTDQIQTVLSRSLALEVIGALKLNRLIRTAFETLYFSGAHVLLAPFCRGVGAVFTLHHVRPPRFEPFQPNGLLEIAPEFLETVIAILRDAGVEWVSLDEMHRRMTERDFARRFACLTLDDGYRDNKQWAYPILKRQNVPFAIYVPSSFPDRLGKLWWRTLEAVIANATSLTVAIDGERREVPCASVGEKGEAFASLYWWLRSLPTNTAIFEVVADLAERHDVDPAAICTAQCMTWNEIAELASDPLVTIGAHTVNHVILSKAPDAVAMSELKMGRGCSRPRSARRRRISPTRSAMPAPRGRANSPPLARPATRPPSPRAPACSLRNMPTTSSPCRASRSTAISSACAMCGCCSRARAARYGTDSAGSTWRELRRLLLACGDAAGLRVR
jgi:peptidoglycan/xylan/chitin deacetylase (PgdA/CDA1 family)